MQGGSSDAFRRVQSAYATLRGASTKCLFRRSNTLTASVLADHSSRAAHDEALQHAGVESGEQGPFVVEEGQTSGHSVSQFGLTPGVTVKVHGQRGPSAPVVQASVSEDPMTETEALEETRESACASSQAGHAALAACDARAAIAHLTAALRALHALGEEGLVSEGKNELSLKELYAARARAHRAAGDERRAQCDHLAAEENEESS